MASDWHPIFLTAEPSPGVWTMKKAGDYVPFGQIELRRTKKGPRYKVTLRGEVIGWAGTLQVACERLWTAELEHAQRGEGRPTERAKVKASGAQ